VQDAGSRFADRGAISSAPPKYVIITGHGRSGTNWLLSLLDASPDTHCRNSPYLNPESPMAKLPSRFVQRDEIDGLDSGWDEAIAWSARHMGAGDQRIPVAKRHLHRLSCRLGLASALYYGKTRRLLALVTPGLRRKEWAVPFWLGKNESLASALPVLRTSQVPGWVCWALAHRPEARVLHIVRHPGGFLNSWRNRYLKNLDPGEVRVANLARLRDVAQADAAWAAKFGDVERLSLEESELWYWRYATEEIHRAGAGRESYRLVVYESLVADTVSLARTLYAFCGVDWSAAIAAHIARGTRQSQQIAGAWRTRCSAGDAALIDRILADSPMHAWWDDGLATEVSGERA